MAKVGDTVRYLNAVGGGKITRIDGNIAYVDEDGFETPVLLKECVVVASASPSPSPSAPAQSTPKASSPMPNPAPAPAATSSHKAAETFVVEETPQGEKLNIVLAFEALDLKRLSSTTFDAYLVNDSNYYLSISFMTRDDNDHGWTLRYSGEIQPGMQVFLCEIMREDLPHLDHIALQYVAYKKDREFELKPPACVTYNLDTTKFCKLHCFQHNVYFDQPVIALPIVSDDRPCKQLRVNSEDLATSMQRKIRQDNRPAQKPIKKKPSKDEPLVVDLHIDQLVDTTAGMNNADMLNLQVDTFRRIMDSNLRNHGLKIIFIHGKGDGVLRRALLKELSYRYRGFDVQDASFQEYGYGATQVKIK